MIGELLCFLGFHKWRPIKGARMRIDWRSKWEAYEVVDGECIRPECEAEAELRRAYYW